MRVLLALLVGVLLTACSNDDELLDGLDEIGTTSSGAEVYAVRSTADEVRVVVMVDGDPWCNGSGPSGTKPPIAMCSGTSPDGSIYVAPADKAGPTKQMCDLATGASVGVERVATPDTWTFDLVVATVPGQQVFLAPCRAILRAGG